MSSWPFAVAQNIETLYFEKNQKLLSLPIPYLVNCCQSSDSGIVYLSKTYQCLEDRGMATSYP